MHFKAALGTPGVIIIIFTDIEKAFDSVLKRVLLSSCRSVLGSDVEHFLMIIKDLYEGAYIHLADADMNVRSVLKEIGVHQGDALSPVLFVIVMEFVRRLVMSSYTPLERRDLGYRFLHSSSGLDVNLLDYADDDIRVYASVEAARKDFSAFYNALETVHLKLNVKKCKVLAMRVNIRSKTVEAFDPMICINNTPVDAMSMKDTATVLGVSFTGTLDEGPAQNKSICSYIVALHRIDGSNLDIPRKLDMVRMVAVPILENSFWHTSYPTVTLRAIDKYTRAIVRKWCGINVPTAMIEAPYKPYGGLAIGSLTLRAKLFQVLNFVHCLHAQDPVVRNAVHARLGAEKKHKHATVATGTMQPYPFFDWFFNLKHSRATGLLLTAHRCNEFHVGIEIHQKAVRLFHKEKPVDGPNELARILKAEVKARLTHRQRFKPFQDEWLSAEDDPLMNAEILKKCWNRPSWGMVAVPSSSYRFARSYLTPSSTYCDTEVRALLRTQLTMWWTRVYQWVLEGKPDDMPTKCRFCDRPESIQHLLTITPCEEAVANSSQVVHPAVFGSETMKRHNSVVRFVRRVFEGLSQRFEIVGGDEVESTHAIYWSYCSLPHSKPDLVVLDIKLRRVWILDVTFTADEIAHTECRFQKDIEKNAFIYDSEGFILDTYKQTGGLDIYSKLHYSPSSRYIVRYNSVRDRILLGRHNLAKEGVQVLPLVFGVRGFVPMTTQKRLERVGLDNKDVRRICYAGANAAFYAALHIYKAWNAMAVDVRVHEDV